MHNNDRDYHDLRTQLERDISEAGSLKDIAHKAKDLKGELAYDSIIKSNEETLMHLDNGNFMPYPNQRWGDVLGGIISDHPISPLADIDPNDFVHSLFIDPNNGFA